MVMRKIGRTFGQSMTDQELKRLRNREYYQRWKEKNPDKFRVQNEKQRQKKAVYVEKRHNISHVGFKCVIGTLDRFLLNTAYIDGKITVTNTTQENLKGLRRIILDAARNWVMNQDFWDKHKRIFVVDFPESSEVMRTKSNTVNFQFTLLRVGEFTKVSLVDKWKELWGGLEPFCEDLYDIMKKAVESNGLKLVNRYVKMDECPPAYASNGEMDEPDD